MGEKDFSKIVEDHNYFSDAQEDSVCKVTRAMDALEEQHYILTTFGEEKRKNYTNQGMLRTFNKNNIKDFSSFLLSCFKDVMGLINKWSAFFMTCNKKKRCDSLLNDEGTAKSHRSTSVKGF